MLQLSQQERKTHLPAIRFCKFQGEEFKTSEISERYNVDLHIISKYGHSYANELAISLLDEDVSDDLAYFEWNRTVTTFRYPLQNSKKSREIRAKVTLVIEYLVRNKCEVTHSDITNLINLGLSVSKRDGQ